MIPLTVYRITSIEELPAVLQRMPAAGRSFVALPGYTKEQLFTLESAGLRRLSDPAGLPDAAMMEQAYLDLISAISSRRPALWWWASTLSEKNEHASCLYSDLVSCVKICKTLELSTGRQNVILICKQVLAAQVNHFCQAKGISFLDCKIPILRRGNVLFAGPKIWLIPCFFVSRFGAGYIVSEACWGK